MQVNKLFNIIQKSSKEELKERFGFDDDAVDPELGYYNIGTIKGKRYEDDDFIITDLWEAFQITFVNYLKNMEFHEVFLSSKGELLGGRYSDEKHRVIITCDYLDEFLSYWGINFGCIPLHEKIGPQMFDHVGFEFGFDIPRYGPGGFIEIDEFYTIPNEYRWGGEGEALKFKDQNEAKIASRLAACFIMGNDIVHLTQNYLGTIKYHFCQNVAGSADKKMDKKYKKMWEPVIHDLKRYDVLIIKKES